MLYRDQLWASFTFHIFAFCSRKNNRNIIRPKCRVSTLIIWCRNKKANAQKCPGAESVVSDKNYF